MLFRVHEEHLYNYYLSCLCTIFFYFRSVFLFSQPGNNSMATDGEFVSITSWISSVCMELKCAYFVKGLSKVPYS